MSHSVAQVPSTQTLPHYLVPFVGLAGLHLVHKPRLTAWALVLNKERTWFPPSQVDLGVPEGLEHRNPIGHHHGRKKKRQLCFQALLFPSVWLSKIPGDQFSESVSIWQKQAATAQCVQSSVAAELCLERSLLWHVQMIREHSNLRSTLNSPLKDWLITWEHSLADNANETRLTWASLHLALQSLKTLFGSRLSIFLFGLLLICFSWDLGKKPF